MSNVQWKVSARPLVATYSNPVSGRISSSQVPIFGARAGIMADSGAGSEAGDVANGGASRSEEDEVRFRRLAIQVSGPRYWSINTDDDAHSLTAFVRELLDPTIGGFAALRVPRTAEDGRGTTGTWLMSGAAIAWLEANVPDGWVPAGAESDTRSAVLFLDLERLKAVWTKLAGSPMSEIAPRTVEYGRAWLSLRLLQFNLQKLGSRRCSSRTTGRRTRLLHHRQPWRPSPRTLKLRRLPR